MCVLPWRTQRVLPFVALGPRGPGGKIGLDGAVTPLGLSLLGHLQPNSFHLGWPDEHLKLVATWFAQALRVKGWFHPCLLWPDYRKRKHTREWSACECGGCRCPLKGHGHGGDAWDV